MTKRHLKQIRTDASSCKGADEFRALSHRILLCAHRGLPIIDFMREVSKMLIDFSGTDVVELRMKRRDKYYLCEVVSRAKQSFRIKHLQCTQTQDGRMIPCSPPGNSDMEKLCRNIILGNFDPSLPFFTKNGSFWTGDVENLRVPRQPTDKHSDVYAFHFEVDYRSIAIFPLVVNKEDIGLLQFKSKQQNNFMEDEIEFYEDLARTLGVAMAHRRAQVALRERIKELACLYRICQLYGRPGISLEEIMQGIVELLPPALLYPEIACGRIILDGRSYTTPGIQEGLQKQTVDIIVGGEKRGVLEVAYREEKPELDKGPFLEEERNLLEIVAREVAAIIERKQTEEDKTKLQEQLRHADRLVTIGQLAAGVAHELNEPLGNILGFAQLAKKCPGLPKQAEQDIENTVIASLHAREVVKKLTLFARRMPPKKTEVSLNQLVEEGLYFLELRCAKEGIGLVRSLSPDLPEITADPGQLIQVLVNLVVNALQAMPQGGRLTIQTLAGKGYVSLIVEDTGIGMSDEVMRKIFTPFFTTKEVDQGTGLGLPVVHGIVTSHGGSIKVDSKLGQGTRFEVKLPLRGGPGMEKTDKDGSFS